MFFPTRDGTLQASEPLQPFRVEPACSSSVHKSFVVLASSRSLLSLSHAELPVWDSWHLYGPFTLCTSGPWSYSTNSAPSLYISISFFFLILNYNDNSYYTQVNEWPILSATVASNILFDFNSSQHFSHDWLQFRLVIASRTSPPLKLEIPLHQSDCNLISLQFSFLLLIQLNQHTCCVCPFIYSLVALCTELCILKGN